MISLLHLGTVCLCVWTDAQQPSDPWDNQSHRRAFHSLHVKPDCHCSTYQKKILERRLAEADGLPFTSFRNTSMPPTVKAARVLSLQGHKDIEKSERSATGNSNVHHIQRSSGRTLETQPVGLSGEPGAALARPLSCDWLTSFHHSFQSGTFFFLFN